MIDEPVDHPLDGSHNPPTAPPKFKAGDTVRCAKPEYVPKRHLKKGLTQDTVRYEVVEVLPDGGFYRLKKLFTQSQGVFITDRLIADVCYVKV